MSQPPAQALITMLSTHFMKRCIAEDVEPCLFYSYNYSGAQKTFGAGGLSSSAKKRLLDNIQKGLCEIIVPSESDKGSGTSSKVKCGICTVTKECQHKLRQGEKTKPEDLTVCRPCRDRVAASVDFFAYANYLRQNKQTFSILSIFRCFMWLRKRLASARVSSCSLFDGDFTSIASAYAMTGDWEQNVHIQN